MDDLWMREMLGEIRDGQRDLQTGQGQLAERLTRVETMLGAHDRRTADHSQRLQAIEAQRDRAIGFLAALTAGAGTAGAIASSLLRSLGVMP